MNTNETLGKTDPSDRPGNPIPRNLMIADWALGRGVAIVDSDGNRSWFASIEEAIEATPDGWGFACESSTYGSFNTPSPTEALELAAGRITLFTISAKQNSNRRFRAGLGREPKKQSKATDFEDADAMHLAIRTRGTHLKLLTPKPGQGYLDKANEIRGEVVRLRATKTPAQLTRNNTIKSNRPSLLDLVADDVLAKYPVPQELAGQKPVIGTMAVLAPAVSSRAEMERIAGLSESGYPNMIRSQFYHWGYRSLAWPGTKRVPDETPPKISLTEYRKLLRRLFQLLKDYQKPSDDELLAAWARLTPATGRATSFPRETYRNGPGQASPRRQAGQVDPQGRCGHMTSNGPCRRIAGHTRGHDAR